MQKGKGIGGGIRWLVILSIVVAAGFPDGRSWAYDLPGARERGLGRANRPGIAGYGEGPDSPGMTIKTSISYTNLFSIVGLDAFEFDSSLRYAAGSFRGRWAGLRHAAYSENRFVLDIYRNWSWSPIVPGVSLAVCRRKAGRFRRESGWGVRADILVNAGNPFIFELSVPLSDQFNFSDRRIEIRSMLRSGRLEFTGDLRFISWQKAEVRSGVRFEVSRGVSLLSGYDVESTTMTAGIAVCTGRMGFVFSREFHPVLGSTLSAAVERAWIR